MPERKKIIMAFTVLTCIIGIAVTVFISSCTAMRNIDDAIWSPPPATPAHPTTDAPPIIEIAAGVLSLLGFGGMAGWLRSIRNSANGKTSDLDARLTALEKKNGTP